MAVTQVAKKRKRSTLEKSNNIASFFQRQHGEKDETAPPLVGRRGSADHVPQAFWSPDCGGWSAVAAFNTVASPPKTAPITIDDSSADESAVPNDKDWRTNPIINQYEEAPAPPAFTCPICSSTFPRQNELLNQRHVNDCLDANTKFPLLPDPPSVDVEDVVKQTDPSPRKEDTPCQTSELKKEALPKTEEEDASPNLWSKLMAKMTGAAKAVTSQASLAFGEPPAQSAALQEAYADAALTSATRPCPWYKKIPGTSFTVDAFRFGAVSGCTGYLLTHFHSDHYGGLTSAWRHGPIYCSPTTGDLCIYQLKVKPEYIHRLPMNKVVEVDGARLLLSDANHCPGSAIISIQPKGSHLVHVHTGDFRYAAKFHHPDRILPAFQPFGVTGVDIAYLDTTYLGPKHTFPDQDLVINGCAEYVKAVCEREEAWTELVLRAMQEKGRKNMEDLGKWMTKLEQDPTQRKEEAAEKPKKYKVLICVGTYLIGKERIFQAIAEQLGAKVWANEYKRGILNVLGDAPLKERLTSQQGEAQVHLCRLGEVTNPDGLCRYLVNMLQHGYTHVMAFRPTGWTFKPTSAEAVTSWTPVPQVVTRDGKVAVFGVPYSEHSNFYELRAFVKAYFRSKQVIPTVNVGSPKSRERMSYWIDRWREEARKEWRETGTVNPAVLLPTAAEKLQLEDDEDDLLFDEEEEDVEEEGAPRTPEKKEADRLAFEAALLAVDESALLAVDPSINKSSLLAEEAT